MRLKPLPEPAGLDAVADAQSAVPLVPGSEHDCCGRLMRREGLESRDLARTWLTFLRALELAEDTGSGFRRTDREPTAENLRASFSAQVFGADRTLDVLRSADGPLTAGAVFERLRGSIPNWERERRGDWESHWRERTERLLGWLVVLDLAERVEGGYVAVDR